MKRYFLLPLISALIGGGVVVGVLAAVGDLGSKPERIVTEVRTQPIAPSNSNSSSSDTSAGMSPNEIYKRDAPGVVYVKSTIVRKVASPFDPFGGETEHGEATGSGFVIDGEGLILTNWHVVENAERVTVSFEHGGALEAKVLGKDPSDDLALLKISPGKRKLTVLTLGDSSAARVGDPVLAIGNPFGLARTLTTGVVSALQRQIEAPNKFTITNVIQTDAPINPGNSGGPLLNSDGEVIGITSQIETSNGSDGNIGIGFAVPINTAKKMLPQLEAGETVRGTYLGVSAATIDSSLAGLDLPVKEGALVEKVYPGTPASKAGIRGGNLEVQIGGEPVLLGGDIIIEVDGEKIKSNDSLSAAISSKKVGQKVKIVLMRHSDGHYTKKIVEATLGERPTTAPESGSTEEG